MCFINEFNKIEKNTLVQRSTQSQVAAWVFGDGGLREDAPAGIFGHRSTPQAPHLRSLFSLRVQRMVRNGQAPSRRLQISLS